MHAAGAHQRRRLVQRGQLPLQLGVGGAHALAVRRLLAVALHLLAQHADLRLQRARAALALRQLGL
jgi:hypothetical protein